MADLVHEGGGMDEEELVVLEKSGILASRKLQGKAKARSVNGPKHVVFVEEGEEGPSRVFSVVFVWRFISTMLLDTYAGPSNPAPAPKTISDDDEPGIDLGWKSEGRQKRKKGKQKSEEQEHSDLQLLEEESKVWRILVLFNTLNTLADPKLLLRIETPAASGSGALGTDGTRSAVTVCRAGAGDAEVAHGERPDEEVERSRGGEGRRR